MDFKGYEDNGSCKWDILAVRHGRNIRPEQYQHSTNVVSDAYIPVAFWNGLCIGIYEGNYRINFDTIRLLESIGICVK